MSSDRLAGLPARYRVTGGKVRLDRHDPDDTAQGIGKKQAAALLAASVRRLAAQQEVLAANAGPALLVVVQAMDAGGKDGTIRHVMSGVNPQGVRVTSFKQPSDAERHQDFLRRIHAAVPARGEIALFNRSHYEDVLVARVHPDQLDPHSLRRAKEPSFWDDRLADIVAFEAYLARQGVVILKLFLHISSDEQRRCFLDRLDDPDKQWKLSAADLSERQHWDEYQRAYEQAISATAAEAAPWFIVPANHKWFARLVVVETIVQALEQLGLDYPKSSSDSAAVLEQARRSLEAE